MSQTTTQESPAIDRLLSYINEYRHVIEFCTNRKKEYEEAQESFVDNPEEFKYWSGRVHALTEVLEIMEDRS